MTWVDKFTSKIKKWPAKKLAYSGKIQLIHFVLMSMFVYWNLEVKSSSYLNWSLSYVN